MLNKRTVRKWLLSNNLCIVKDDDLGNGKHRRTHMGLRPENVEELVNDLIRTLRKKE